MPISTYAELQASIASWLVRTDLTAVIPDFITLAEGRIARDLRLRRQVASVNLSTVAATQTVALPSDFLEAENLTITNGYPPGALSVVTPEILDRTFPDNILAGQPVVYAIIGDNLAFGPTPDAVYTVKLEYYQRFAALSTSGTNWLLTNHPSLYLNACLVEGHAYLLDADKAQAYDARYRADVEMLQTTDDASLRSGSSMRVRAL